MKRHSVIGLLVGAMIALVAIVGVVVFRGGVEASAARSQDRVAGELAEQGVLLVGVDPESPAATTGLRRGDIILSIDGQQVDSAAELAAAVAEDAPGERVILSILRCDAPEEMAVVLGESSDGERPYLGVQMYVPDRLRMVPGDLDHGDLVWPDGFAQGALVEDVLPDTPAAEAGLQAGDRILAVNDEQVSVFRPLSAVIRSLAVGDEVELLVERDGEELLLAATLVDHPDQDGVAYLGVRVAAGEPGFEAIRGHLEPPAGVLSDSVRFSGSLVVSVDEDSPADAAGLEAGDVITAIDGESLVRAQDLVTAIQALQPGDETTLTWRRDGEEYSQVVRLAAAKDDSELAYLGVHVRGFVSVEHFDSLPFDRDDLEWDLEQPWPDGDGWDLDPLVPFEWPGRRFFFWRSPDGEPGIEHGELPIPDSARASGQQA